MQQEEVMMGYIPYASVFHVIKSIIIQYSQRRNADEKGSCLCCHYVLGLLFRKGQQAQLSSAKEYKVIEIIGKKR